MERILASYNYNYKAINVERPNSATCAHCMRRPSFPFPFIPSLLSFRLPLPTAHEQSQRMAKIVEQIQRHHPPPLVW